VETGDSKAARPDLTAAEAAEHVRFGGCMMEARPAVADGEQIERLLAHLGKRCIVLVGMMGAGKTSIGRRLANLLHLPFLDADSEIEAAANLSIPEIFAKHGEADFREGEKRVVARLLASGPAVLATGGGAYMSEETRERCRADGVTIWLKADASVMLDRVRKKGNRPLLDQPNPEAVMRQLLAKREPIYALADITIASREGPHQAVIADILAALDAHFRGKTSA
jgi:shikimate kinase